MARRSGSAKLAADGVSKVGPAVWLALSGVVLYLLVYYLTPLPSYAAFGGPATRGELLAHSLLLIDQVVASWFGDPPQFALIDRLPVLLATAVLAAIAWLAGGLALQALGVVRELTRLERLVFALGVGFNLLSLYMLAIGLAGWLASPALILVPGGLLALLTGVRWRKRRAESLRATDESLSSAATANDWISRRWAWCAVPFAVAIVLGGMLPPVEFDVREYHLQAPKEFYQQGRITFLPHNIYANMPLGAEMGALAGMVLTGDWWTGALVGKTLIALFAPLTALALFTAGRRWFSTSAGLIAGLLYLATPWIARVSNLGLIDAVLACYLFLALYAVWLAHDAWRNDDVKEQNAGGIGASRYLALAGFLAGAAVACKYTGMVFVVLPLGAWVLFYQWRWNWRPALIFALAVAGGCGLWLGKNWALTGNPTYPLLVSVFDGATRTAEKDAQWRQVHRPENHTPASLARHLADVAWRSEWLSPLLIPLALLAWFLPAQRRATRWLWLYFGLIVAVWWLATHRLDRFWLPGLPVLALLAGAGATWSDVPLWRRGLQVGLGVGLATCFLLIIQAPGGYTAYFESYARLRVDPLRVDPWHLYLNANVPLGQQALLVGDAEVFDLEVPVLYSTVFDDEPLEQLAQGRPPAEVHAELAQRKISHIYVHWDEIARYRSPGNYGFSSFVQPELLDSWVAAGVLSSPLPPLENHGGQVFEVLPRRDVGQDLRGRTAVSYPLSAWRGF